MNDVEGAHKNSIRNWAEVEACATVACFFCRVIDRSNAVTEWIKDQPGETTICPHCSIDSVIGDAAGFALSDEVLNAMHERFFLS